MTTISQAASKAAIHSTASSRSAYSRRSSPRDSTAVVGGFHIHASRPTKRARLSDHSSTTSVTKYVAPHSQSTTPVPNDSNQDVNIPDIIATPEPLHLDDPDSSSPPGDESAADEHQDDSDSDEDHLLSPVLVKRGRWPNLIRAGTPTGSVADSLIPGSPFDGDLDDNGSDHDGQKGGRRLPGRRRAPNADPYLEACLRRQLVLRMGHRAVSKALKPVLIELAIRTAEQLYRDEDDEYLWEVELDLQLELQEILQSRLEILDNQARITTEHHIQEREQDEEYLQMQFEARVAALQEDIIVRSESRVLELARQYEHELDGDATDDEDGTIFQALYCRPSKTNPAGILHSLHDSRSRLFLETERLGIVRDERTYVGKQQETALQDNNAKARADVEAALLVDSDEVPDSFGSANNTQRIHALAALNIQNLAHAAREVEYEELRREQPLVPVIPNVEALGLQALAAAAEQPARSTPVPQMSQMQPPYPQLPPGPLVKQENSYPDLPAHAYPAAPPYKNGINLQTTHLAPAYEKTQGMPRISFPNPPSSVNSVMTHSVPSHSRTTSESAAVTLNPPTQRARGYSMSQAPSNGPIMHRPFVDTGANTSLTRTHEYTPHLTQTPKPQILEHYPPHLMNDPAEGRQPHPFWQNVLSEHHFSTEDHVAEISQAEDPFRRRSEANIVHNVTNGIYGHSRMRSAPVPSVTEDNPFRPRSPPRLRSPQVFENQWAQQNASHPPPLLPGHNPSGPPLPTVYYQTVPPHFSVPYVIYQQPPPPPPGGTSQRAPQQVPQAQQPGVFFGPPPPPQYGSSGPQQQYPWYRH